MNLSENQLRTLSQIAIEAAKAAGSIINAHRETNFAVEKKETGTSAAAQVVTEVDHKAQSTILERLAPTCGEYHLALLTEESPDDGERHEKPAFWSIDPMDGTLNFVNHQPGFSVSIGLVAQNGAPLIGIAYDPVSGDLYRAIGGQGAFLNDQALSIPPLDPSQPLVLRTDFSFETHPWLEKTRTRLEQIAEKLGLSSAEIRYRTGAVLNACEILQQPNICYFKYPKQGNSGGSLWDYAATACLYGETGGVATDILGQPMELNRQGSTFMNHRGLLYASDKSIAEHVLAMYRDLNQQPDN